MAVKKAGVIIASTRIKDVLESYPELRDVLMSLSPKFKKLNNRLIMDNP